jgi:hypothetical protein
VREDGWMGAAPCLKGPLTTSREKPIVLRYLLHAHRRELDVDRAGEIAKQFAARPGYEVVKANVKHQEFAIRRQG